MAKKITTTVIGDILARREAHGDENDIADLKQSSKSESPACRSG